MDKFFQMEMDKLAVTYQKIIIKSLNLGISFLFLFWPKRWFKTLKHFLILR